VEFKVDLEVFSGPLDLLLYLVKKHEVDVTEVPIARIATEFVAYLDVLQDLAIDQVGEFVELASVLLEIKARALVPRPEETEEPVDLVREDLVQRLLEYKQFRDAAAILEDRARQWELRFSRVASEPAGVRGEPAPVTIADVHVWDLVGAMSRVLRKGRVAFSELFDDDMPKSRVVGIFLAVLELVRRGRLATRQERLFEEIWLERPAAQPPIVVVSPPEPA